MKLLRLNARNLSALAHTLSQEREEKLCIENAELNGISLHGFVLRDIYFSGGDLEGIDLTGADLRNIEFEGTILYDARFDRIRMGEVMFYEAQASGSVFREALLTNVNFQGSDFSRSTFEGAKFHGVSFEKDKIDHKTNLSGAIFLNTDLRTVAFNGVKYDQTTQFPAGFLPERIRGLINTSNQL